MQNSLVWKMRWTWDYIGKMDLTRSMVVSAMSCQRSHMVSSPTQPSPSRPVYFTLHGGRGEGAQKSRGESMKDTYIFPWFAFFFHVYVYMYMHRYTIRELELVHHSSYICTRSRSYLFKFYVPLGVLHISL